MQVAEVASDDIPMRLLALQVELDEIDQDPLEVGAQLRRGLEWLYFLLRFYVLCAMTCSTPPNLE